MNRKIEHVEMQEEEDYNNIRTSLFSWRVLLRFSSLVAMGYFIAKGMYLISVICIILFLYSLFEFQFVKPR